MAEYRTVTLDPGETRTFEATANDPVENLLIDQSATGAYVRLVGGEDGFVIRNVGVRGRGVDDGYNLLASASGLFENIYLADGSVPGRMKGGYLAHKNTRGPVTFRNVHIGRYGNNGLYVSPTSLDSTGAVVHIEDSFFPGNNISNFKIGSPYDTCTVTNTTIRTDADVPHNGMGQINKRGFIALDGYTVVEDCDISGPIQVDAEKHSSDTTVELVNTRWDGDKLKGGRIVGSSVGTPDLSAPAGVPMSPEEAASGTGSGGGGGGGGGQSIDDAWNDSGPNNVEFRL